MVPIYGESRVQLALIHTDPARAIHSSAAFTLGVVLYAKPIITRLAMVFLVCYDAKKPAFGWGIRQVYEGLILGEWVAMWKFLGEMFDGASTIVAMGRQAEFNAIITAATTYKSHSHAAPRDQYWSDRRLAIRSTCALRLRCGSSSIRMQAQVSS
jgi:hypothetical protein